MNPKRFEPVNIAPQPFHVLDANGRENGLYYSIESALHARDFLNEHGLHGPYTVPLMPEKSKGWRAA